MGEDLATVAGYSAILLYRYIFAACGQGAACGRPPYRSLTSYGTVKVYMFES